MSEGRGESSLEGKLYNLYFTPKVMFNQVYLGSGEITESLRKVAGFGIIRLDELDKYLASLPTQDELLEKLKQNLLGPKNIYNLSKQNPSISKQLIDFGL